MIGGSIMNLYTLVRQNTYYFRNIHMIRAPFAFVLLCTGGQMSETKLTPILCYVLKYCISIKGVSIITIIILCFIPSIAVNAELWPAVSRGSYCITASSFTLLFWYLTVAAGVSGTIVGQYCVLQYFEPYACLYLLSSTAGWSFGRCR